MRRGGGWRSEMQRRGTARAQDNKVATAIVPRTKWQRGSEGGEKAEKVMHVARAGCALHAAGRPDGRAFNFMGRHRLGHRQFAVSQLPINGGGGNKQSCILAWPCVKCIFPLWRLRLPSSAAGGDDAMPSRYSSAPSILPPPSSMEGRKGGRKGGPTCDIHTRPRLAAPRPAPVIQFAGAGGVGVHPHKADGTRLRCVVGRRFACGDRGSSFSRRTLCHRTHVNEHHDPRTKGREKGAGRAAERAAAVQLFAARRFFHLRGRRTFGILSSPSADERRTGPSKQGYVPHLRNDPYFLGPQVWTLWEV